MHTAGSTHVAVLAAVSGLSPTIPLSLSLCSRELLRARSNLTCPSFLHPLYHPQLPTQWTVPTIICCQSKEHTANVKQRRWTAQHGCVYRLRDKATLTCMECVSIRVFISTLLCFCSFAVTPTYYINILH